MKIQALALALLGLIVVSAEQTAQPDDHTHEENEAHDKEMAEMEARMKQAESDYAHAQEEAHAKAAARAA